MDLLPVVRRIPPGPLLEAVMSKLKLAAVIAATVLHPIGVAVPTFAATAHNSQAGSWGPNSHQCAPTPYFREGGCLSSYFVDQPRRTFDPRGAPYKQRRFAPPTDE